MPNARYYDPELGRFIQPDTMLDGLNRYTYCGGNPIVYADPSGHVTGIDDLILGLMYVGALAIGITIVNVVYEMLPQSWQDTISYFLSGSWINFSTNGNISYGVGGNSVTINPVIEDASSNSSCLFFDKLKKIKSVSNDKSIYYYCTYSEELLVIDIEKPNQEIIEINWLEFLSIDAQFTEHMLIANGELPDVFKRIAPEAIDPSVWLDVYPCSRNPFPRNRTQYACLQMAWNGLVMDDKNPGTIKTRFPAVAESYYKRLAVSMTSSPYERTGGYVLCYYGNNKHSTHAVRYEFGSGLQYRIWWTNGNNFPQLQFWSSDGSIPQRQANDGLTKLIFVPTYKF